MPTPTQLGKLQIPGADPAFQIHYNQLTDAVNTLAGHNGTVKLANHLDMDGNRVQNIGDPSGSGDAISHGVAESSYSAPVLSPQLESPSRNSLKTYRQLNNQKQREASSSFLNDLMSTPPSANTVFPTVKNSGNQVIVSIPESTLRFSDGSSVRISGRTDILSRPSQYLISSLSVSNGIVTVQCAPTGLVSGEIATIVPGSNSTFAGTFQLLSSSSSGSVLQYQSSSASGSDISGHVQENGVYYYSVRKGSRFLTLSGPYTSDTANSRLEVNFDGSQIVAVVVITSSGAQTANSGGGGSPITGSPTGGVFF